MWARGPQTSNQFHILTCRFASSCQSVPSPLGSPLLPPPAAKKKLRSRSWRQNRLWDEASGAEVCVSPKDSCSVCISSWTNESWERVGTSQKAFKVQTALQESSQQSWPWVRVLWVMSPSEAGDQDQGEAGTVVTREARSGEHLRPEPQWWQPYRTTAQKKCEEPKRRVGPSAFFLFGNARSQNLAGEIHNHLI